MSCVRANIAIFPITRRYCRCFAASKILYAGWCERKIGRFSGTHVLIKINNHVKKNVEYLKEIV